MKGLKIPSWLKTLLFASIGVSLLYFAFKGVDLKAVGKEMGNAKLEWIGLSMLVGLGAVVSRGMRWKLVLDSMGYRSTSWRTSYAIGIGYLINMVFPRAGEVARATALRRSDKIPVDVLLGTIIVERLIDLIIVSILLGLTLILTYPELQKLLASTQGSESAANEGGIPWLWIALSLILLTTWFLRDRFFKTAPGPYGLYLGFVFCDDLRLLFCHACHRKHSNRSKPFCDDGGKHGHCGSGPRRSGCLPLLGSQGLGGFVGSLPRRPRFCHPGARVADYNADVYGRHRIYRSKPF